MMDKRAGVYKIVNTVNGKVYIGSSKDLKEREYRHFYRLKRNNHSNPYLQNAYNAGQSLKFETLEYCVPGHRYLLEQLYIDGRKPEYNFVKNVHKQWEGRKHSQSKEYKVINPEGVVVTFKGIIEFLNKYNLSSSGFYQVLNGELYQYYGWRAYNKKEIGKKIKPRSYKRVSKIVSPDGEVFVTKNGLTQFAKDHNLLLSCLCKVINGEQSHHKGWKKFKQNK